MAANNQCPRCHAGRLRGWNELSDEEREVARRLPASADYTSEVRERSHEWCTRCWYEECSGAIRNA